MYMIVGLGNPGERYHGTRHNIGFHVLDQLAERRRTSFAASQWQAVTVTVDLWGVPVVLVKPLTYMNESGKAVRQMADSYQIQPHQIIVIHDDLDLELARIKVAVNRGAGGHNGILSLISQLNRRDFTRVRIGIGRPEPSIPIVDYVLSRFHPWEQEAILQQMGSIEEAIRLILVKGPLAAMAIVNSRKVVPQLCSQ